MKNLENILQEIQDINWLAQSKNISDKAFHSIFANIISWYRKRLKNYYPFMLLFIFFIFILIITYLDFYYILKNESIGFLPFFIGIFFAFFAIKIVIFSKKYKKIQTQKIEKLNFLISKFHFVPNYIIFVNNEFGAHLKQKNKKITTLEISEQILKTIEKISKYQKILPIFFRRDYINSVNSLILQEIQLLQNILEYSFHHQIQNHKKIISEISNLQNNEWKHFSEILELQKTRLENQKKIFEKILGKKIIEMRKF